MKEKSRTLVNEFLKTIPFEYRSLFNELAEYAAALGYSPRRTKTKHFSIDFAKSKLKKTIMKFEDHDNGIPSRIPGLRLKFYANKTYTDIFGDAIPVVMAAGGVKLI